MKLPRDRRITSSADFRRVRESGRSLAGGFLVLAWRPIAERGDGEAAEPSRFGFVTSRKVGGAVVRNRVRRRLRAVVREFGEGVEPGFLVVTVARFRAGGASFEQLRRDWRWLARKAGLLARDGAAGGDGAPSRPHRGDAGSPDPSS